MARRTLAEILQDAEEGRRLNPADEARLRESLKGYAPSSAMYQRTSTALNNANPPSIGDRVSQAMAGYLGQDIPSANVPLGTDWRNQDAGSPPFAFPMRGGQSLAGFGGMRPGFLGLAERGEEAERDINARRVEMMANWPDFPGGAPLAANPTLAHSFDPVEQALNFYREVVGDYAFAGADPSGVGLLARQPAALTSLLAQDYGAAPWMQAAMAPDVEAALALAGTGMLGHAQRGEAGSGMPFQNLTSSPPSDVEKLMAAEDFLDQLYADDGRVRFADVDAIYQDAFNRAVNTNFGALNSPQTGQPLSVEEVIELTNKALLAAAPFMSQESQSWLAGALNHAAVEYTAKTATGEISMSYPAYLKSLGFDQFLSGAS